MSEVKRKTRPGFRDLSRSMWPYHALRLAFHPIHWPFDQAERAMMKLCWKVDDWALAAAGPASGAERQSYWRRLRQQFARWLVRYEPVENSLADIAALNDAVEGLSEGIPPILFPSSKLMIGPITHRRRFNTAGCPADAPGPSQFSGEAGASAGQASGRDLLREPRSWEALRSPEDAEAWLEGASGEELREMAECLLADAPVPPALASVRAHILLGANASEGLLRRVSSATLEVRRATRLRRQVFGQGRTQ